MQNVTVLIKILQSDWPTAFWSISLERFSQAWDLCRNIATNINFLYKPNSEKLMTKFFIKFQKHNFWSIFPISEANFFQKIRLCHAKHHMSF